jgi:hypothetical protein
MFEDERNDFTDRLFTDPPSPIRYPTLQMIGTALHAVGVAFLVGVALEALNRMASK